jgi:hypothetical protein
MFRGSAPGVLNVYDNGYANDNKGVADLVSAHSI